MTNRPSIEITDVAASCRSKNQTSWRDYFGFNTDHKVIGIQYLVTAFIFFLIAGLLAMLIRGELLTPELNLVARPFYNSLFTMHGTIMIFLWIIPSLSGLANYLVPLMIASLFHPTATVNLKHGL